ncbi:MAG TPA: hypothetical protein VMZ30_17410, partial [Pyrinomonadaceae bacterium]|nr:hypothetical protein [Pyrinomonadaceae bacterium]
LGAGLLGVMLVHQFWTALSSFRNSWLARYVFDRRYRCYPRATWDSAVYSAVWPAAWRSGVGSAMSFGLIQISGIFHAQSRDLASVNSYLLGLRLVQAISQFSQAPFYSKLPSLAKLYAAGDHATVVALAKRGMKFAYWSFVAPAAILAMSGALLLDTIGSAVPFPSTALWLILCSAILIERYGAMHLQLYSTTNHIVWHVANGVTGVLMVLFWIAFYPKFGATGLAVGMLAAYAAFFSWFGAVRAHRAFALPFPRYDLMTAGGPLLLFLLACAAAVALHGLR